MITLQQALDAHKILIAPDFTYTKMQRHKSQWLRAYDFGIKVVYFGCYKTGLNEVWKGEDAHLTPEEKKALQTRVREAHKEMKKAREEEMLRVRLSVEAEWPNKIDRGTTEYLTRKKIPELFGCKIDTNEHGPFLLVPARDIEGNLWNYQRIYNVKFPNTGDKFFLEGAKIEGCFHVLNQIFPEGTFYICEGFATAASIHLGLQNSATVVAAFNAGNLLPVACALRHRYPLAKFIFCADDDQWVFKSNGAKWNPGLEYAQKASDKVDGLVLPPRFQSLQEQPTDWNDLHLREGIDCVKEQLKNPQFLKAGPQTLNANSEAVIVASLLAEYEAGIVKVDRDIFLYNGIHWEHLDPNIATDMFYRKIDALSQGKWKHKDIMSAYNRLLKHIESPAAGIDMFSPRPDCINLLNGTLHLVTDSMGKISLNFRPHERSDYLVNVLPYKHDDSDLHHNQLLLSSLDKMFPGTDAEGIAKKNGVMEMFGSSVCGMFPMLFMLFGEPETGKSTIANVVKLLVGQKNTCQVPPTKWNGFHMWSMLGKQVNIDTDIPTKGQIQDDMIKKVMEGGSVFIQRKNLSDVSTRITPCNIFCANKLPSFIDGATGAQKRRWLVFRFTHKVSPDSEIYDLQHWNQIFNSDPQGVFNYALSGVVRLCERQGVFTRSESSRSELRNWEETSDPAGEALQHFLADIEAGEIVNAQNVKIVIDKACKIERKMLWEIFKINHEGATLGYGGPRKEQVFAAVQRAGFGVSTVKGVRYFTGIGVKEGENSAF